MSDTLAEGDIISDFTLPDHTGTKRSLQGFLADGPVVLFFYPAAMTTGCTAESCRFRDLTAQFAQLGAQQVGISRDDVAKQREFADTYNFDFPLLSDVDSELAKRFNVKRRLPLGPLSTKRMTFVIDTDRRLLAIIHNELKMNDHADRALAVLQQRADES